MALASSKGGKPEGELMYDNFVHARALAESRTIRDIAEKELDLYPYSRKKTYIEPYFAPIDHSLDPHDPFVRPYKSTNFKAALTDAGICQVYNGDSLHSSYAASARTQELQNSLDPRLESIEPNMINGTGKISQITMWLDAGKKDIVNSVVKEEGSLMVAINGWQTYYDV